MELNVDTQELDKFSALAHRWWDPSGEFAPLHQINPLRLDWIRELCPLQDRQVLDVGCGDGQVSRLAARLGADVVGIDPTWNCVRVAAERGTVTARAGAAGLPFAAGSFDTVVA